MHDDTRHTDATAPHDRERGRDPGFDRERAVHHDENRAVHHDSDRVEVRRDADAGYAASNVNVTTADRWMANGRWDRVRWGPIWAGLVTAIATFLLLTTAAVAIGAQVLDAGADPDQAGMAGGIVSAVLALVAFLAGGFIAARTAGVVGRGYGALNGFLVWALGVVLILGLAAFGLGSLFGASGDLFAQYQQMGQPQPDGVDQQQVVEGIRNSSIGALIAMLLPAIAAAIGGTLGGREELVTDR